MYMIFYNNDEEHHISHPIGVIASFLLSYMKIYASKTIVLQPLLHHLNQNLVHFRDYI